MPTPAFQKISPYLWREWIYILREPWPLLWWGIALGILLLLFQLAGIKAAHSLIIASIILFLLGGSDIFVADQKDGSLLWLHSIKADIAVYWFCKIIGHLLPRLLIALIFAISCKCDCFKLISIALQTTILTSLPAALSNTGQQLLILLVLPWLVPGIIFTLLPDGDLVLLGLNFLSIAIGLGFANLCLG